MERRGVDEAEGAAELAAARRARPCRSAPAGGGYGRNLSGLFSFSGR